MGTLSELLNTSSNITISISLNDLRQFHSEVMEDSKKAAIAELEAKKADEDLSIDQMAKELGRSVQTLRRWDSSGYFESYKKVGNTPIYKRSQINQFIRNHDEDNN